MINCQKDVIYVGPYSFPNGGAAARRIYGNCISLKRAGYNVIITTGQAPENQTTKQEYNGIPVISLSERRHESLPKLIKHFMYFSAGKRTISWLNKLEKKPEAIILYSGYSPYLIRLIPWAKKNKVKLFFDTVEWYDPPNIFSKLLSPYFLNIELAMRSLLKRCDGLIVISDYLKNYYKLSAHKIIQVPPTIDCENTATREKTKKNGPMKFVYAGTPGKKDSLSKILEAVLLSAAKGRSVELHIAGIKEEHLPSYLPLSGHSLEVIKKIIKCHGILEHKDALNLVRNCDYSIILRPNTRSVQAGFPTKFVESLAVGTPVIANLTSDIGRYLINGENGFICRNSSTNCLIDVIDKCFDSDMGSMRKKSRETAENHFDAKNYASHFRELIGNQS